MSKLAPYRVTTTPSPVSTANASFHRNALFALSGIACLLAPQWAQATPTITSRSVYADPCTTATTSNTNSTINSSSCSGSTYHPATNAYTTVDTLTTAAGDYVAFPPSLPTNSGATLVVFLGGSNSVPGSYTQFIERSAYNGFAAISLTYPDGSTSSTVGDICSTKDACYTEFRGSAAFGTGILYDGTSGSTSYNAIDCTTSTKTQNACNAWMSSSNGSPQCTTWTDSTHHYINMCYQDSVVGRLIAALQSLQSNVPSGVSATDWSNYWGQFFTSDSSSPYYGAFPQWTRIILVGHSQGGGEAAFLAMNLPSTTNGNSNAVQRDILFSSPEDNTSSTNVACYSPPPSNTSYTPAGWVTSSSPLSLSHFWGLRSGNSSGASTEGCYGAQAAYNWSVLESTSGSGIPQGSGTVILDDGGCLNSGSSSPCSVSTGQHRFVISAPLNTSDLYNHDDTVVDYGPLTVNLSQEDPDVAYVWDHLLTAAP